MHLRRQSSCIYVLLFSLVCIAFSSCGRAKLTWIQNSPVVAVNESDESVPVNIRFFQLRDWRSFNEAAFDDLWSDSQKALGYDLVEEPFEITVYPSGEEKETPRVKQPLPVWKSGANYLGAILLHPVKPEVGARRVIVGAKDAANVTLVVENGSLSLVKR